MIKYLDIAIANDTIETTDIKGKEYAEVNQRIKEFRMVYPDGILDTQMISNENGVCIFKAQVGYYEDNIDGCVRWLGTGYAYEKENSSFINKTSYIQNGFPVRKGFFLKLRAEVRHPSLGFCGVAFQQFVDSFQF